MGYMADQLVMTIAKKKKYEEFLSHKIPELEKTKEVKLYLAFQSLPPNEKIVMQKEWNDYYIACRKTRAYERWQEQSKAFHEHDLATVKQLAEEAREFRLKVLAGEDNCIPQPAGIDPYMLSSMRIIGIYKHALSEFNKLQNDWELHPEKAKVNDSTEIDGVKPIGAVDDIPF